MGKRSEVNQALRDLYVEAAEQMIDFMLQHASEFLRPFSRTMQDSKDLYLIGYYTVG